MDVLRVVFDWFVLGIACLPILIGVLAYATLLMGARWGEKEDADAESGEGRARECERMAERIRQEHQIFVSTLKEAPSRGRKDMEVL